MASLNQDWRDFWLRSPFRSSEELSEQWWYVRLGIWAIYFGVILIGSVFLLHGRTRITSIYNVDQESLDQALSQALDRLHLNWRRVGHLIYIGGRALSDGEAATQTVIAVRSQVAVEDRRSRMEDRGPGTENQSETETSEPDVGVETS